MPNDVVHHVALVVRVVLTTAQVIVLEAVEVNVRDVPDVQTHVIQIALMPVVLIVAQHVRERVLQHVVRAV